MTEIVHESAHTRITRLLVPGRSVIGKEPLGPDAESRLRHEVAMLERLRGVVGLAQLVEVPRPSGSIMLVDAGGTSLAGVAKPLGVDELVRVAAGLARAVAGMHRCGWRRDRPSAPVRGRDAPLLPMPRTFSFPSGHATSAAAFATRTSLAMPAAAPVVAPMAATVAYSRGLRLIATGVQACPPGFPAHGLDGVWDPSDSDMAIDLLGFCMSG